MFLSAPAQLGYPVLAALILGESAGVPLPGETALLTAGGLAAGAAVIGVGLLRARRPATPPEAARHRGMGAGGSPV